MRKLVTTIDEIEKEVFLDGSSIILDSRKFSVERRGDLLFVVNGEKSVQIDDVIDQGNGEYRVEIKGYTVDVKVENPLDMMVRGSEVASGTIRTPLTGVVSKIFVNVGDSVEPDTVLMTISAMKMENKILAKVTGRVMSINVNIGDQVNTGSTLLELEI